MKKSMRDTAFQVLSNQNQAMPFLELWNIVADEMGFNQSQKDDNIAQFYSDLSVDGRFTNLKGNQWDLRKRQSHATTIINPDSISVEDEEDEEILDDSDEAPLETTDNDDE